MEAEQEHEHGARAPRTSTGGVIRSNEETSERHADPASHATPVRRTEEASPASAPRFAEAGRLTPRSATDLQGLVGNGVVAQLAGGLTRTAATATGAASPRVQRITEEESHRHPPGDAVRVRGPRDSDKKGRTPNEITDAGAWARIDSAADGYPGFVGRDRRKQRLSIREDPQALKEGNPQLRDAVSSGGLHEGYFEDGKIDHPEVLEHMGRRDPQAAHYWHGQDARDKRLAADTEQLGQTRGTDGSEPEFADAVDTQLAAIQNVIGAVQGLLADHDGVIMGDEAHTGSRVWGFLVANLAALRAAGVATLYLESLQDDSHQSDVDAFMSTGQMSPQLTKFAGEYDRIRSLNPGLTALLQAARGHGMRVRGINGRPARKRGPKRDLKHRRAATMNTYAEWIVRKDREGQSAGGRDPGKYLMEAGIAHGPAHRSQDGRPVEADGATIPGTFPGLSDLLGVPAVEFTPGNNPQQPPLRRLRPPPPPQQQQQENPEES